MKSKYSQWICSLLLLLTAFSSCSKDEGLVPVTEAMRITVSTFSTDPQAVFSIKLNGDVVDDSIFNAERTTTVVTLVEGLQKLTVNNRTTGALLIDTLIDIKGNKAEITLMQLDPKGAVQIVRKSEDDLPADKRRLAFYYDSEVLPDSLAAVVYYCWYHPETYEFISIKDTARYDVIKRGELSEFHFISGDGLAPNAAYFIDLLDAQTGEHIEGLVNPFDPAAYMGYQVDFGPGPSGTEKNFINNIVAVGSPDFFDIFSNRLITY